MTVIIAITSEGGLAERTTPFGSGDGGCNGAVRYLIITL